MLSASVTPCDEAVAATSRKLAWASVTRSPNGARRAWERAPALGVDIETEQADASRRRLQQSFRMTAHTHCPVDHPPLAPRPQQERDLVDEDRNVNRYTPSCANRSNSDGNPSPFDRSYS